MSTLVVLAKKPEVGFVKTRLGNDIGLEKSAKLYECFIQDAISQYQNFLNVRVVFYVDQYKDEEPCFFTLIKDKFKVKTQVGDSFSEILKHIFQCEIKNGPCLIIGSDHPNLPTQYLRDGLDYLNTYPNSVVLGKDIDGGCYLLGMNKFFSNILDDFDFSNNDSYSETISRLTEYDINYFDLPTWYNISGIDDLKKLVIDLNNPIYGAYSPTQTLKFLRHDPTLLGWLGEDLEG